MLTWSFVGSTAVRFGNIVGAVCAARLMDPVAFGEVGTTLLTVSFLVVFACLGMGAATSTLVARASIERPDRLGLLAGGAIAISCVVGCTIALLLLLVAPAGARGLFASEALAAPLRWSALLLWLSAVTAAQTGVLVGLEEFRGLSSLAVIRAIGTIVAFVVGALRGSSAAVILGLAGAELICAVGGHTVLASALRRRCVRLDVRGLSQEWRVLSRFGLPSMLAQVSVVLALWLARLLLLRTSHGSTEAGVYDAAWRWSQLLLFVPTAFAPTLIPMLSRLHASGDHREFQRALLLSASASLICVAIPAIALLVFSDHAMRLFGAAYATGDTALRVLVLGSVASALNTAIGSAVVGAGRLWTRAWIDVALGLSLIVVAYFTVSSHGALGLAISQAVSGWVAVGLLLLSLSLGGRRSRARE